MANSDELEFHQKRIDEGRDYDDYYDRLEAQAEELMNNRSEPEQVDESISGIDNSFSYDGFVGDQNILQKPYGSLTGKEENQFSLVDLEHEISYHTAGATEYGYDVDYLKLLEEHSEETGKKLPNDEWIKERLKSFSAVMKEEIALSEGEWALDIKNDRAWADYRPLPYGADTAEEGEHTKNKQFSVNQIDEKLTKYIEEGHTDTDVISYFDSDNIELQMPEKNYLEARHAVLSDVVMTQRELYIKDLEQTPNITAKANWKMGQDKHSLDFKSVDERYRTYVQSDDPRAIQAAMDSLQQTSILEKLEAAQQKEREAAMSAYPGEVRYIQQLELAGAIDSNESRQLKERLDTGEDYNLSFYRYDTGTNEHLKTNELPYGEQTGKHITQLSVFEIDTALIKYQKDRANHEGIDTGPIDYVNKLTRENFVDEEGNAYSKQIRPLPDKDYIETRSSAVEIVVKNPVKYIELSNSQAISLATEKMKMKLMDGKSIDSLINEYKAPRDNYYNQPKIGDTTTHPPALPYGPQSQDHSMDQHSVASIDGEIVSGIMQQQSADTVYKKLSENGNGQPKETPHKEYVEERFKAISSVYEGLPPGVVQNDFAGGNREFITFINNEVKSMRATQDSERITAENENITTSNKVEGRLVQPFKPGGMFNPIKDVDDAQKQHESWEAVANGDEKPANWQHKAIRQIKKSSPEFNRASHAVIAKQMAEDWAHIKNQMYAAEGKISNNYRDIVVSSGDLTERGFIDNNNEKTGRWIGMHENGKFAHVTAYFAGQKHGTERTYNEQGELQSKGSYAHNTKQGTHFMYEQGHITEKVHYNERGEELQRSQERQQNNPDQGIEYGR